MAKVNKAKQAAAANAVDGDYKVLSNLRHNGKGYVPKSTVKLDAKSAAELLARGVVEPIANAAETVEAEK
jgi:hypothetical protein